MYKSSRGWNLPHTSLKGKQTYACEFCSVYTFRTEFKLEVPHCAITVTKISTTWWWYTKQFPYRNEVLYNLTSSFSQGVWPEISIMRCHNRHQVINYVLLRYTITLIHLYWTLTWAIWVYDSVNPNTSRFTTSKHYAAFVSEIASLRALDMFRTISAKAE